MRVLLPVLVVLAAVGFLLASPVPIPFAIAVRSLDRRRLRAAALRQECPTCGGSLGLGALRLADERWRAEVAELHRRHPGVKLRLVRFVDAICPTCGADLSFHHDLSAFRPVNLAAPFS